MAIESVRASSRKTRTPISAGDVAKFAAAVPESKLYGVFGPQYASLLAQPTDSAALQVLNAGTLQMAADRERIDYAEELARANAVQERLQDKAGYYGLQGQIGEELQGDVELGIGGARSTVQNPDGTYGLKIDPIRVNVANAAQLDTMDADALSKRATGYGVLADKLGVRPSLEYLGKQFKPQTQTEDVPFTDNYMSPSTATERYSANEGMTVEERMELERIGAEAKARAKENGDEIEYSFKQGSKNSPPDITFKGTREALIRNGIDPDTGKKINPNAGANGGTAPASPTAAPKSKFFSPAKMTSDAGMRKHPISGMMKNHDGQDFGYPKGTPIPAEDDGEVVFSGQEGGYGNTVKVRYKDGSVIAYSHNDRNSVKVGDKIRAGQEIGKVGSTGRSTGPHVHRRQVKAGVVPQSQQTDIAYATRLQSHPSVAKAVPDGRGNIVVTLKNGKNVVYSKGKRIG